MEDILDNLVYWICKKENNKVFVAIVVIFILFVFYKICYPRLVYRDEIQDLLKNKYNKNFEIEYHDYDKMIVTENQNIKGIYVYKIYTKDIPDIYSYVICEKMTSGNVNIYESNAPNSLDEEEQNGDYYGNNVKVYNQKIKVEEGLKSLYGQAIEFDLLHSENTIFIEVKTKMEDSLYDNFEEFSEVYNSTIDLLKGTNIIVSIRYADCLREITGNTEKLTQENISSLF